MLVPPVVAAVHGQAGNELTDLKDAPKDFSTLREGKYVFHLDDHESSLEMTRRILEPAFGERLVSSSDSENAVDTIAKLACEGKLHCLIIDMDMSTSGRKVLMGLAKRNIYVPFVILSGGQGNPEYRAFMKAVSDAKSVMELEGAVEKMLEKGGDFAFCYLPKEDVACDPALLVRAVDATLLAGQRRAANLDLMVGAAKGQSSIMADWRSDELDPYYSTLSDEALSFLQFHFGFVDRLDAFVATHKPIDGEGDRLKARIEDIKKGLGTKKIGSFSYETVRKVQPGMDFEDYSHSLFGSECLTPVVLDVQMIEYSFDGLSAEECHKMSSEYMEVFKGFQKRYDKVMNDLNQEAGVWGSQVNEVVSEISDSRGFRVEVRGHESVTTPKKRLATAFGLALTNAKQAIEHTDGGRIWVDIGAKKMGELAEGVQSHFSERGFKSGDKIVVVEVNNNGPKVPDDVMEAWNAGAPILSTKGEPGRMGVGLKLMRETVGSINGGIVTIDPTEGAVKVTFYLPKEPKEKMHEG